MFQSNINEIVNRSAVPGIRKAIGPPRSLSLAVALLLGATDSRSAFADGGTPTAPSPLNTSAAGTASRSTGPSGSGNIRETSRVALKPSLSSVKPSTTVPASAETAKPTDVESSISQALRMIGECKSRFRSVNDYSCDFYKRERINGTLTPLHVMTMKERTQPKSIYFKFKQPNRGREAIYVEGKNNGSILAHDVGFTKFLAGTMELDPKGWRAMENNRHPITEAGIGELIDTIEGRWAKELHPKHSVINHFEEIQVGPHNSVVMIESIHPEHQPGFLFHKVRLFINREHGLPIRFEAYDWPRTPDGEPELVEEYTYLNLKLNQGLKDIDFDPANAQYSFGRF